MDPGPDGNTVPPTNNSHLTSAFEDVVLIPLASWVFLLLLLPTLGLIVRRNRQRNTSYVKEHTRRFLRWHDYLKIFFALAVIALACLEIARLAKLGYGIGLLPFTPTCVFIAIIVNVCRHRTIVRGKPLFVVVMLYFVILLAFQSVKLNTQLRLEKIEPRKGTPYPASDQVIDLATLAACLGVLIVLTLLDLFLG